MSKKIMVIDDEPDVVIYLSTLLEENGYSVVGASDGMEGMQLLEETKPDLICLDVHMPEDSGIRLFELLKTKEQWRNIPVLIVTGYKMDDPELVHFTRTLSAKSIPAPEGFLEKPINRESFLMVVRQALRGEVIKPETDGP